MTNISLKNYDYFNCLVFFVVFVSLINFDGYYNEKVVEVVVVVIVGGFLKKNLLNKMIYHLLEQL
jgi:hypothetical protein